MAPLPHPSSTASPQDGPDLARWLTYSLGMPLALRSYMAKSSATRSITSSPRSLKLIMSEPTSEDDRDTLPPSPATEPPPGFNPLPSETLKRLPGYDDNQFLHVALAAAADAAQEIREARKAFDVAPLLNQQTKQITERIDQSDRTNAANHALVSGQIRGLASRIGQMESSEGTRENRLERMEIDMAVFRQQVEQRMGAMAAEIDAIKKTKAQ